jgi:hypothetical protein
MKDCLILVTTVSFLDCTSVRHEIYAMEKGISTLRVRNNISCGSFTASEWNMKVRFVGIFGIILH